MWKKTQGANYHIGILGQLDKNYIHFKNRRNIALRKSLQQKPKKTPKELPIAAEPPDSRRNDSIPGYGSSVHYRNAGGSMIAGEPIGTAKDLK
jgi:hypothetical protein